MAGRSVGGAPMINQSGMRTTMSTNYRQMEALNICVTDHHADKLGRLHIWAIVSISYILHSLFWIL
jgi:hypothetical protein